MAKETYTGPLEQVDECCWRIPKSYKPGMRVDGLIFADERLLAQIKADQAPEQVANVAFLPGIQHASLAMPDIHWGYGFCIGGVCATDPKEGGVISPGGVGYDINCGVRLLGTALDAREMAPGMGDLVEALYRAIPAGVGSKSPLDLDRRELNAAMRHGVKWAVERGLGEPDDVTRVESDGALAGAVPENVSAQAAERGRRRSDRGITSWRCRWSTRSTIPWPQGAWVFARDSSRS